MHSRLRILPTVAALAAAAAVVTTSCGEDRQSYVANLADGNLTPTLVTESVRTFISDSGYTRFFIQAPVWYMYDEAQEPHWLFPEGLSLDEYDRDMQVIANVVCDTARYNTQKKIWRLRGNVVMVNTERDSFLTQLMYWDQNKREVYSDSFIHIVRADRILEGYGFTSNENITRYKINNPTGIFPNAAGSDNDSNRKLSAQTEPVDTAHTEPLTDDEARRQRRFSRPPKRYNLEPGQPAPPRRITRD